MAEVSYIQGKYLTARAFLQRYEAGGVMDEESLYLGFMIESKLGDEESAERYRMELLERYPSSIQAGRTARNNND